MDRRDFCVAIKTRPAKKRWTHGTHHPDADTGVSCGRADIVPRLTTMPAAHIHLKIHREEFDLWAKNLRTKDIKRVQMKTLKSAGFKVMLAERREVKRRFRKRPARTAWVANSITYQPVERRMEVWVGPFRGLRAKTKGKRGSVGANAAKIVADWVEGSHFAESGIRKKGEHATRLRGDRRVAVPSAALEKTRGSTGVLRFKSVRHDLTAKKVMGDAKSKDDSGKQSFILPKGGGGGGRKRKNDWIAVRSNRQFGDWGFQMRPSKKFSRKGKRAVAAKWPWVIPLMVLIDRAKVRKEIQFARVARKTAPRAMADAWRKEFSRGLPVTKALGVAPTSLNPRGSS